MLPHYKSFGFHFEWNFMSMEGAQEIGSETTGNQRKGRLGAGVGLTCIAENHEK